MDVLENGWIKDNSGLKKVYELKDFNSAVVFLNEIASVAEKHNHHPDLFLFKYKFVEVTLFTHEANSVTEKDRKLAACIDLLRKD